MKPHESFARRVFFWAGVYGLVALLPQYGLEHRVGVDYPPAITHPEYFYGFVGVAVAWQVAFLIIARDPMRFWPLFPAAVVEKAAFGIAVPVLFALGRVPTVLLPLGGIDLLLGTLFLLSYLRCRAAERGA